MKQRILYALTLFLLVACSQTPESSDVAGTPVTTSSPTQNVWTVSEMPTTSLLPWGTSTQISSSDLPKPVVINLWASWCSACAQEMPLIAQSPYASNVVAINVGDLALSPAGTDTATELVKSTHAAFPIYVDEQDTLMKALRVNGLPVTFAVNAKNKIVDYEFGELTNESLARLVKSSTS